MGADSTLMVDYIMIPVGALGLLGLYGFCFRVDLKWKAMWLGVLLTEIIYLAYSSGFAVDRGELPVSVTLVDIAILALFHGPYWYALHQLYRSGAYHAETGRQR